MHAPTLDVYIGSNLNFERLRACARCYYSLSVCESHPFVSRARLIWANILIARGGGGVVAKPLLDLLFGRIPTSQSVPLCVCRSANKIYCRRRRRVAARTHGDNPPPCNPPMPARPRPALFAIWPLYNCARKHLGNDRRAPRWLMHGPESKVCKLKV
jgi:hypothetical protein